MLGNSTLSFAGQSVITPQRHQYSSPHKNGNSMKDLITYGNNNNIKTNINNNNNINESPTRFKQKQPLSQYDYYYSQNPQSKEDYARMLEIQIEQKKSYKTIQNDYQKNDRNLGKVNNINPHFLPSESIIAPNYGFQTGLKTVGSNFGQNTQQQLMQQSGNNYSNVFNPKLELQRTQPRMKNIFNIDEQQQQQFQQSQSMINIKQVQSQNLKLSNQAYTPLILSSSQFNYQNNNNPIIPNYTQSTLLNSIQGQYGGLNSQLKKSVNFQYQQPMAQSNYSQGGGLMGQRQRERNEEIRESFFDKWRDSTNNNNINKAQNFRGILKKENMSDIQIFEKERKQQELNQALQEQILYKKKKQEIEDRQRKLEDLVFAEKLRQGDRNNSMNNNVHHNDNLQIKAVAAQADRLQQRNLASRRQESSSLNKSNFEDIKEIPRTPPNMSSRNQIVQQDQPMVRIEKIIDFSSNRVKAPSPTYRRSSGGNIGNQQKNQVLSEVKEAAELDMDYIKDYYEFQKKVFNRQMATLQKEVSGVNDQRTQVFKDMLLLREKSKQEHLMNLMKPSDVLDDNRFILAQRKQNLYNFHQLDEMNRLGSGNQYLQNINYLPSNEYNFNNYYSDKQYQNQQNQLISQSQLVPPAQLFKAKNKKNNSIDNGYDHSEQIIGEMRRKLEQQNKINRQKPLSADSKPKKQTNESQLINNKLNTKNSMNSINKNNNNSSVENEFLDNNEVSNLDDQILGENEQNNNNKTKIYERPTSSQSYNQNITINIEQFRNEVFPNKRLQFEIMKEQQKEQQSYIEQYIWEKMSQDSSENEQDELDEQIKECMGEIEAMVNKESIKNVPQVNDRKLSEIEMQRKMKAFLKGKELQEEHLQLLLREQAKEKLRQIEQSSDLINYSINKDNNYGKDNNSNNNSNLGQGMKNGSQSNILDNNQKIIEEDQEGSQDGQDNSINNDNVQEQQQEESQKSIKEQNNVDEEDKEQLNDNDDNEEKEIKINSQTRLNEENNKKKGLSLHEIAKIQETDESGVSDKYDDKQQQQFKSNNLININDGNEQVNIKDGQQNEVNEYLQKDQQKQQKKVIDQNKLQDLYQDIIKKNSKNHDSNLFEKSLHNIDDMLAYFRENNYNNNNHIIQ